MSFGLRKSCGVSQGPPSITITKIPLKMQIPRPPPRPGNLHFQQASQLILRHLKSEGYKQQNNTCPGGTTTNVRVPLLG